MDKREKKSAKYWKKKYEASQYVLKEVLNICRQKDQEIQKLKTDSLLKEFIKTRNERRWF